MKSNRNLQIVSLFFASFMGFLAANQSEARRHSPEYSVVELDVIAASKFSGERLRIAVIGPEPNDGVAGEVHWRDQVLPGSSLGTDGLSDEARKAAPQGQFRDGTSRYLSLSSLFGAEKHDLRAAPGTQRLVYRWRVVKSCPVKLRRTKKSDLVKKNVGMWAVPAINSREVTQITPAPCYEKSDEQFQVGPIPGSPSPETVTAKEKLSQAAAQAETEAKRSAASEEFKASIREKVAQRVKSRPAVIPQGNDYDSQVKAALCPWTSALMRALDIEGIKISRELASTTKSQGYSTVNYEWSVHLRMTDGREVLATPYIFESHLREVSLNDLGCVETKSDSSTDPHPTKARKDAKGITSIVDKYLNQLGDAHAEKLFPRGDSVQN